MKRSTFFVSFLTIAVLFVRSAKCSQLKEKLSSFEKSLLLTIQSGFTTPEHFLGFGQKFIERIDHIVTKENLKMLCSLSTPELKNDPDKTTETIEKIKKLYAFTDWVHAKEKKNEKEKS